MVQPVQAENSLNIESLMFDSFRFPPSRQFREESLWIAQQIVIAKGSQNNIKKVRWVVVVIKTRFQHPFVHVVFAFSCSPPSRTGLCRLNLRDLKAPARAQNNSLM